MNCYMPIIWALATLVDASIDDGNETIINVTTTAINDTTQASQILLPDGLLTSFGPMLDMYASPAIREFIVSWHQTLAGWLGFDPTILLSLGPIVWAFKRIWSELVHLKDWVWEDVICNYFTARVEVGDDDPIFIHTMRWVAVQPDSSKTRFLQADTIAGSADDHDEDDEAGAAAAAGAAALKTAGTTTVTTTTTTTDTTDSSSNKRKKKQAPTILPNGEPCLNFSTHKHQKPPRFLPAVNVRYKFWWSGGYFWLNRTRSQVTHSSEWRGLSLRREEKLVITCVGFSPNPIKNFIQFTKEWNHNRQAATTVVRRPARPEIRSWGGRHVWAEVADRPIRPMDTVVLDEKQKLMVLTDMNEYLHRDTAQWYGERGIPLRRGYLFHGPPGTGKTSLSFALAGVFGLDIFVISLLDQNLTEDDLAMLFTNLPRRCVVLLEDIDTAGLVNRDKEESESSESSDSSSEEDSEEDNDYLESEEKRALEVLLLKGRLARRKRKNKGKGKGEVSPEDAALEKELAEKVAEYRKTLKQEGSDEEEADEEKDTVGDKVSDGEEDTTLTTPEKEAEKTEKPVKSGEKPTSSSSAKNAEKKDDEISSTTAGKKTKGTKKPMTDKEKKAMKKKKRMKKSKMLAASTIQSIEFIGRGYRRNNRHQRSPYDRDRGISLSGLLNAIDGVASHEGRVLIMTTNKPEKLDEALLRPGRVDLQIAFLNATQEQVRELFERMYEADVVDPAQITFTKVGGKLTASTTTAAATPTPGSDGTTAEKDQEKEPVVIDPKIVDLKLLDNNNRKSSVSSCSSDATAVGEEDANTPSSSPLATTTTPPNTVTEKPQEPEKDKKGEPVPLSVTPLIRSELQKIAKDFSLKIPKTQVLSPAEIQGFLLRRKKDPRRALAEVDKWVEELVKAKETKSKILDAKAI
ncbi:BCS1 N terminal-domain-containing protein [Sordaria brevicollis]|uniref:BCS1 N terminal-domain-containing protein n=1 Tax=Sordaria brevicollis TaxID=83679 RepID=A0AAE0PP35_SORBR|nr:BCS1 N terminal-domain-containing protein [Sordaria brevicollis]